MATEYDELIKRFNNFVSGLDISQQDKLTLLVLITEIGYKCKKTADAIDELHKRKHGKWIRHLDTRFGSKLNDCIECNCCGVWFSSDEMIRRSFCPNCGADMREETEDIPMEYFESGGK